MGVPNPSLVLIWGKTANLAISDPGYCTDTEVELHITVLSQGILSKNEIHVSSLSPAFSYTFFFISYNFFSSFISGLLKNTIVREILQNHEKRKKKKVKNANFDITVDANKNHNQIQIVTKAQVVKLLQPPRLHKSIQKNNFKKKSVFLFFWQNTVHKG